MSHYDKYRDEEENEWKLAPTYVGTGTTGTAVPNNYTIAVDNASSYESWVLDKYFGGMPLELLIELAKTAYPEYFI